MDFEELLRFPSGQLGRSIYIRVVGALECEAAHAVDATVGTGVGWGGLLAGWGRVGRTGTVLRRCENMAVCENACIYLVGS